MAKADGFPDVEVRSREDLRRWLSENHATAATCWLVTYKKHTPHYLPFGEFVEELLCWGWVDSVTRKVDEDRSAVRISPRSPKSAWSAVNKRLVEKARASGAMTEAGEALIAAAKANGMWSFLDDVERLEVPPDLDAALARAGARETWSDWGRSVQRAWLERIKRSVKPETRAKNIAACAEAARTNAPNAGLR